MVSYAADSHTRYGTLVFMPRATYPKGEMLEIREWGPGRLLGQIPQAEQTYNVIGNMNEHQVLIGESTWGGREEFRDPDAILDYGSLIYICLQRAKTAREAIEIFTTLADEYGYASAGESISVADPNEVWFMDIIGKKPKYNKKGKNVNKGAVWVAIRIPDGYISAHANCARIATFPKNDPENCLYAKDVISHAKECGLYEGDGSDFSFADTYGPLDFSGMRSCEARVWSFFNRHGDEDMSKYIDFARGDNPKNRMPLYVKAKEKLSVKVRFCGDTKRTVSKVAICSGSGGGVLATAMEKGADVLITGDTKYHQMLDSENDINVIDAGHFGTEGIVTEIFAEILWSNRSLNHGKCRMIVVFDKAIHKFFRKLCGICDINIGRRTGSRRKNCRQTNHDKHCLNHYCEMCIFH